jgi:hypothetical protein
VSGAEGVELPKHAAQSGFGASHRKPRVRFSLLLQKFALLEKLFAIEIG